MVGLDLTFAIHDYILKFLADNKTPSPTLVEKVQRGELGFKSGGKGLQDWSAEAMDNSRATLLRYLMDVAVRRKENKFFGD
jgi:3-hydroxybutyryl-CoA dehydrogenase